jgi:hypothetical protein
VVPFDDQDRAPQGRRAPWLRRAALQVRKPVGRAPARVRQGPGPSVVDWPSTERAEDGAIEDQDALRQTSDELLRDLDALGELEDEKRQTPQGDPRLVELAARIEELAHKVLVGSRAQVAFTRSANAAAATGAAPATATIADTPRALSQVLAEWRAAEREVQGAEPGSIAASEARARADRLRTEYRDAFDAARESH